MKKVVVFFWWCWYDERGVVFEGCEECVELWMFVGSVGFEFNFFLFMVLIKMNLWLDMIL